MNPLRVIPLLTALLLAIILGCAAKPQTYTGTLITERCGAGHETSMSVADCVRLCRKGGSPYVLAVGDKSYKLDGKVSALDAYAGTTASVFGKCRGSTIHVISVSAP